MFNVMCASTVYGIMGEIQIREYKILCKTSNYTISEGNHIDSMWFAASAHSKKRAGLTLTLELLPFPGRCYCRCMDAVSCVCV